MVTQEMMFRPVMGEMDGEGQDDGGTFLPHRAGVKDRHGHSSDVG